MHNEAAERRPVRAARSAASILQEVWAVIAAYLTLTSSIQKLVGSVLSLLTLNWIRSVWPA